jgi:ATP-dependent DNA helicase PIF1
MVSGQQMDRLDTMMRQLSQCDEPFGGHRVILVGDPYQLGPVARAEGMLFSSTFFRTILQRFVLTRCFRQENAEFVALLDRIRRGVPTAADHERLRRFESNNVENCVKLVPTKKQAAELNAQALAAVPGVSRVYRARDTVYDQSYAKMLEDMMAPAQLEIKIGSRVMVIRNINDVVVNGSTGIVSGMYDKEIDVKLGSGIISLSPFEFTVEKRGKTLLKRVAFPIVPADAVNIHKSQGLSLDRVYVDCDRMFACGQFYVALSRCKTEQGLMLKNYSPKAIMVDPDVVKFMQSLD